jgi:pyochelin biosynthetic protein PchC
MTETNGSRSGAWFRCYRPHPGARQRLVCLPHAGGSASFFRRWHDAMPESVELHVVQYPGREDRLGERCIDDMGVLADEITRALRPLLGRPAALFGHSMGAAVAHEVARRLEAEHGFVPARLFVSGRPAPHRATPGAIHLQGDEGLLADVRRLGGTRGAVLDDPDLRDLVLPAIRSDYRLIERYRPEAGGRLLHAPVVAYRGDRDPDVDRDEAAAWAETTTGGFELRELPGDHFYLVDRRDELIGDVLARLGTRRAAPVAWPSTP